MKPALFAAAAALSGLLVAPVAQAQISCGDIERVLLDAEISFEEIAGEEIETDFYDTTFVLPGARDCRVIYDWSDAYVCVWEFADEASAVRFGSQQVSELRACLETDWEEEAQTPSTGDEWRLISGYDFTLSLDEGDYVVSSRIDASVTSSPSVYEVTFGIEYLWF